MGFKYLATVGFIGTVIGYCLFRRNSKIGLNHSVLLTDRGWLTNKPLHFLYFSNKMKLSRQQFAQPWMALCLLLFIGKKDYQNIYLISASMFSQVMPMAPVKSIKNTR